MLPAAQPAHRRTIYPVAMRALITAGLVVVAVSSCQSCEKKSSLPVASPQPPVAPLPGGNFFEWLAANEGELAQQISQADAVGGLKVLTDKIHATNPLLVVELGVDRAPGGVQTIVISADGDPARFGAVKQFVAAAPPGLKRFKVVAFRQRRQGDDKIQVEDRVFNTADFFYRELRRSEGKLDIEILVKGMNAENNAKMIKAATLLLDGALGEYDSATKLGEVNLTTMPADPPPNVKPLAAIAQAVDSL